MKTIQIPGGPDRKLITYDLALDLLKRAVDEQGRDHSVEHSIIGEDRGGKYVPVCIVGYALHALDPESFQENHPEGFVIKPADDMGYALTEKALALWTNAQKTQDSRGPFGGRYTWGTALDRAIEFTSDNLEYTRPAPRTRSRRR